MKNLLTCLSALVLLSVSMFFNSCSRPVEGTGPVINRKINLSEFTSIELDIPATVTIALSDTIQGVIRAQENIAGLLQLEQDGDKLEITCSEDYRSSMPVEVVLTTRQLNKVQVNGSGNVNVVNPIRTEDFRVIINGSGDISLQTNVGKMKTEINGSGDVTYSGKVGRHKITVNGSGNVDASQQQAEECTINIHGSGDASLNVTTKLEAKVLGSGNVRYTGTPQVVSEITGSGDISKN